MMIRARLSLLACLTVLMSMALGSAAAWADFGKRYALVIGNSAYGHAEALPNASHDAAQIAQTLSELKFEVFAGFNVSRLSFERLIADFGQQVSKSDADTVLIYYAGHGFELEGVNRLVPIDAELKDRSKIKAETFALDDIIASVQSADRQTIIFLDACRNNPLAATLGEEFSRPGLAQVRTGTNTFVAFATQPGNVSYEGGGSNSPFTEALLTNIAKPGVSLSDMMISVRTDVSTRTIDRQVPWDQSSLRSQFYFNPRVETAGLVDDRQGSGITQSRSGTVQTDASGGEAPAGITIGSATDTAPSLAKGVDTQPIRQVQAEQLATEQQVAALIPSQEVPDLQSVEDDLIKPLQTRLRSIGCYRGAVDGDWGPRSKAAVAQYSQKRGVKLASLEPTDELLQTLEEESGTVCEQPKAKAKVATKKQKQKKQAKKVTPTKRKTAPPPQHVQRHEPYHHPTGPVFRPSINVFGGGGFGIGIGGGY